MKKLLFPLMFLPLVLLGGEYSRVESWHKVRDRSLFTVNGESRTGYVQDCAVSGNQIAMLLKFSSPTNYAVSYSNDGGATWGMYVFRPFTSGNPCLAKRLFVANGEIYASVGEANTAGTAYIRYDLYKLNGSSGWSHLCSTRGFVGALFYSNGVYFFGGGDPLNSIPSYGFTSDFRTFEWHDGQVPLLVPDYPDVKLGMGFSVETLPKYAIPEKSGFRLNGYNKDVYRSSDFRSWTCTSLSLDFTYGWDYCQERDLYVGFDYAGVFVGNEENGYVASPVDLTGPSGDLTDRIMEGNGTFTIIANKDYIYTSDGGMYWDTWGISTFPLTGTTEIRFNQTIFANNRFYLVDYQGGLYRSNEIPEFVVVDDEFTVEVGVATPLDVLANDPANAELTIISATNPQVGEVEITEEGELIFYSSGYYPDLTFTYTVSDLQGVQSTANVSIALHGDEQAFQYAAKELKPILNRGNIDGLECTMTVTRGFSYQLEFSRDMINWSPWLSPIIPEESGRISFITYLDATIYQPCFIRFSITPPE